MVVIKVPVERSLKARLLSTLNGPPADDSYRLTDDLLRRSARGAASLTIISAFYDLKWCRAFIAAAKVREVRLIVNGLGGRRLAQQKRDLCVLKRDARRLGIQIDVRLAFAPGMFHSKLILMEHTHRPVAFIGSANATAAALTRNEEIMLRVSGDLSDLISYADRICDDDHSSDADDGEAEASPRSLIAFFRTGSLYYKSVSTLQLTLNPFREIEREMTLKMKELLGAVELPYTDGKTGVGAFSLVRALNLQADQRSVAAKIKPFVVETSLGYWVPDALSGDLGEVLESAARTKRAAWKIRREAILSTPLPKARALYVEYVNAVRAVLRSSGIDIQPLLDADAQDPLSPKRFDQFYRHVTLRIENESFFERLVNPFQPAGLPELWDDALAREEFEESFFMYVEFTSTLSRCPHVPGTILKQIGGEHGSWETIRKALIKRLRAGWEKDLWLSSVT